MTKVKTAAIAAVCFSFAAAGSALAQTTTTDPAYAPTTTVEQEDDGMDLGWLGLLGLAGLLGLRRKPNDHRADTTTRPTAR